MPTRQIPVFVLAGFLGSGKTTFLNGLLHNALGVRVGVIINDFGDIPVDSWLVDASVDTMVTLGGGCLCCVTDAGQIDDMLQQLLDPSLEIDAVVIEASGLADPANLALRVSRSSTRGVRFAGVVLMVDAGEYLETLRSHPQIAQDGRIADLIVLNKADLVSSSDLDQLMRTLDDSSRGAPVLPTTFGTIDPRLLFDRARHEPPRYGQVPLPFENLERHAHDRHPPHLHDQYASVSFRTDRPLSPHRFLELLYHRPAGLYRLKGHVRFTVTRGPGAARHPLEVQSVGAHVRFARQRQSPNHPLVDETQLVLIGIGVDAADVAARLADCEAETATSDDRTAMITINRYLD
ncbi:MULTISPECIES: CobW family GTP-binding protein [unclassified Pseudoclavibacter]|uniref:CobW family GTP-binding protein n=1 Tax=unclassified Pseudoclavibacter TaxID=2615177 RepID=UPI001301991C|nr:MULTISPECIES: GTP-binding protein [unclassified Pseudoclavibacter]KAB1647313.1 GTP-binding protein [Pseudoclavibacter sp. CFCC 14310]KAB1662694.1 GTP-binding protein [Pseudoclavibacter sp. CFCC 13611]